MAGQSVEQILADFDKQNAELGKATLDDVQLEQVKSMMEEQQRLIQQLKAAPPDQSQSEMIQLQAQMQAAQQSMELLSSTLAKEQQARADIIKNIN